MNKQDGINLELKLIKGSIRATLVLKSIKQASTLSKLLQL